MQPNDVATGTAIGIAGLRQGTDFMNDEHIPVGGIPRYKLASPSVPAGAVGLPGHSQFVNNIFRVEMAELQMWVGKTLDLGNESNRRAFIDYKRDQDGKPIKDKKGLQPVSPSKAAKLLGKPAVVMHGSSKWAKGDNTGSVGKFAPTGKIEQYKPDPSLGAA
jgi:hypothetical protein